MLDEYDPAEPPDPDAWLALDEGERNALAVRAHVGRFPDALHSENGTPHSHGPLHAIVETQIALGDPAAVRATVERLQAAGLQRHPALHEVMRVLMRQLGEAMETKRPFDHARYASALHAIQPADVVASALASPSLRSAAPDEPRNRAERRAANKRSRKVRKRTRSRKKRD